MYGGVNFRTIESLGWSGVGYLMDIDIMNSEEMPLPISIGDNQCFATTGNSRLALVEGDATTLPVHDLD